MVHEKQGNSDTRTAWMDLSPQCSGRDADTQGHKGRDPFTGRSTDRCGFVAVGQGGLGRPALGDGVSFGVVDTI